MDNIEMIPKSKDVKLFKNNGNNNSVSRRNDSEFFNMEASMIRNDGELLNEANLSINTK